MADRWACDDAVLVRAHLRAAAAWAFVCLIAGLAVNALLLWPELQDGRAWLSYGRLRAVHTNVPLYGWFWPVFLATVLHALPPGLGFNLWRPRLARIGLWMWNAALGLGVVLVLRGHQQSREYAELPLVVDVLLGTAFILPAACLIVPLARGRGRGSWLAGLAPALLVLLPVLVTLGNPPFTDRFDAQATGYEGQNILGYCLGGFAIATAFLSLDPAARAALRGRRWVWGCIALPVGAFCLGVVWDIGFGGVPPAVQGGILSCSAFLMVPLLLMTWPLRHAGAEASMRPARLAFCLATGLYLLAGIEGFAQFAGPVRVLVQFTAWMPGHAHLAMAGAMMLYVIGASFALVAQTQEVAPARWPRATVHVLIWTAAMVLLTVVLTTNGWREGTALVRRHAHELDAWAAQRPLWLTTEAVGLLLTADFARYVWWMWTTRPALSGASAVRVPAGEASARGRRGRLASGLAAAGVFTVVMLNLFAGSPAAPEAGPGRANGQAALVRAGKDVYIREGCVACHTMQVRAVDDPARFGPPSSLEEYQRDLPHQLGTRRIGPDLLRIGGKYSDAWHVAHLEDPRALFPGSPMPAYAFLSADERTALVAYLQSRSGLPPETAPAARASVAAATAGWSQYVALCLGCHGADGKGRGPAAVAGGFHARDFTSARLMRSRRDEDLAHVIRGGIPGTAMPAWEMLDAETVGTLVKTVRAFREGEPA